MRLIPVAALLLVAIGTGRIVSTYRVFSHTIDEPDHLAAGMELLTTGKYRYEDQHPPLARVFGAIGPFLAGERWRGGPQSYREGYRILGWDVHYDRILALGRAGILPFFWTACLVVYLWAQRAAGPGAALTAVFFFTTLPPVLAHASLITTDMALACWTGAAALAALYWADRPGDGRTAVLGVIAGLAFLSKFSALLFVPAVLAGMWATGALPRVRLRAVLLACGVAALVVWAGYEFSFARVDYLHARLPAARFFTGLQALWAHNRAGHPSYLFGRRSASGFWYYYPAALAIKTPLAMLIVLAAAVALRLRSALPPLAYSGAILLAALVSRIDIGVRHVLPVYIGFAVVCGCVAAWAWRRLATRACLVALIAWQLVSGARQHPDYLAYTNEIAGTHPEHFLADSDLDWGQDMNRLAAYFARAGAGQVTFTPFNRTYLLAGHRMPALVPGDDAHPSPGWNAVSITLWKVFGSPAWPDQVPQQSRIGRSILVWYFPPNPR